MELIFNVKHFIAANPELLRDALAGTLHYRNQNIFDLVVQKYSFENVLSLLIWNKFPLSGDEHSELSRSLAQYMLDVPEDLFRVINQFP